VNGGRNYNGPKVSLETLACSSGNIGGNTKLFAGNSSKGFEYSNRVKISEYKGTIRREVPTFRLRRKSESFRDYTFGIQGLEGKGGIMKISPDWVSGFVDGEGTFYVGINKNSTMKSGYQVLPEFRIVQHKKDIQLLYALKSFFGCGVVRVNHEDRYELRIRKLEHLVNIVVPFFEKHSLLTQKKHDFLKFRKIVLLISQNKHLDKEGIIRIIEIAEKMNRANKEKAVEIKKTLESQDQDKDIVHA